MIEKAVVAIEGIPQRLLGSLDNRDAALWLHSTEHGKPDVLARLISLPWKLVIVEQLDERVIAAIEHANAVESPLTRKRGFIQVIDSDPSRIDLPPRSLPVYLLNGRDQSATAQGLSSRLRRLAMLDDLARSRVRELVVVSDGEEIPRELAELWAEGFRAHLNLVSAASGASESAGKWLAAKDRPSSLNLVALSSAKFAAAVVAAYELTYPEDRRIIRVRDRSGNVRQVDVTAADDPERPLLDSYLIIQERELKSLLPEELDQAELNGFFQNPEASWRPYAAGVPWTRHASVSDGLKKELKQLDTAGAEANSVAFIASEAGAGGTTLARALAWECAQSGYPVLVAKSVPFNPDALTVANFMKRTLDLIDDSLANDARSSEGVSRYQAPWVIVFDVIHWQYRDSELLQFRNELEKAGRPACILVVTGSQLGLVYYSASFKRIAELNHSIALSEAVALGQHLNHFLRVYRRDRTEAQWISFYEEHTVQYLEGMAAFWVTLSFWLQGQYDLTDSIQERIYRCFKEQASDPAIRQAVLEIACVSSERRTVPEALLPESRGPWPLSQLLDDARAPLAAIGLVRTTRDGEKQWGLVHDILGRLLINAMFYDFTFREEMGFAHATDAEHLRFLLLNAFSQKYALGERRYRALGEAFATSIFKIDPDHGRGSFARYWRQVLSALDAMPRPLRDTSRLFRHHTAISRRRIASLDSAFFDVTDEDRVALIRRAIEDLDYALNYIERTPDSETNLNLYNSLANAYLDLARYELKVGATDSRVNELRQLANDATRRAYQESSTNSFVIETYVKNLLQGAELGGKDAVASCIEALGILFSALVGGTSAHRSPQLGGLADRAMEVLMRQLPEDVAIAEPRTAVDVLVKTWSVLAPSGWTSGDLSDVPGQVRLAALEVLAHPAGRGNMQVLRLTYDLHSATNPWEFEGQLALIEQLHLSDYRLSPQLRLEYAILLFQNSRAAEGDRAFATLRKLWRESEHFVYVPERLRWLRGPDRSTLQTVHAAMGSDYGNRTMARVQEFANSQVPFRPEEFGFRNLRPGERFTAHVTFGHNGPFLRPVTAHPKIGA